MNPLLKERVLLVLALLLCAVVVFLAVWETPDLIPMGIVYSDIPSTGDNTVAGTLAAEDDRTAGSVSAPSRPSGRTEEPLDQPTGSTTPPAAVDGPVNINTASLEDLMQLPGIGEVLAQRILDYRDTHGGFSSIEELMNVSGIGEKRFNAVRDSITVN